MNGVAHPWDLLPVSHYQGLAQPETRPGLGQLLIRRPWSRIDRLRGPPA